MAPLCWCVPLLLCAHLALAAEPEPWRRAMRPPQKVELASPRVEVAATFAGGPPVVEARIDGKGPYRV